MNRVELVGRLTAKPELRYTSANLAVTRFSVAVDRDFTNNQGQREADFINVVAWRKEAENVANYLDKGSLVAVTGRIQTGSYTDKDGNKRTSFDVQADRVQFLSSKGGNGNGSSRQATTDNSYADAPAPNDVDISNDPYAEYGDSVSIDDNFLD